MDFLDKKSFRIFILYRFAVVAVVCLSYFNLKAANLLNIQETPQEFIVQCEGIRYYIDKNPAPFWGGQKYKFFHIGERDQKNSLGLVVNTDTGFDDYNAPLLLLPGPCVKSGIVKNTEFEKCIRVEYSLSPAGRNSSHPSLTVAVYFSFMRGVPGVALNYRLIAIREPVVISQFLSRFGNDFISYIGEGREKREYTETEQTLTGFRWVVASKPGWNILVSEAVNHCAEHGFLASSAANHFRKVKLEKGDVLEFTGLYGIGNAPDTIQKLLAFRKIVEIQEERHIPLSSTAASEIIVPFVKNPIPIGDFSGWSTIPLLVERSSVEFYRPTTSNTWNGAEDLSFKLFGAFDRENLYLRILVTDDFFRQESSSPEGIWSGDCVQFAFDPLRSGTMSGNYIEFGITPTEKPIIWGWRHPDPSYTGDLSSLVKMATKQYPGGYECELAIPWEFLIPFEFQRGKFNCNIVVLDSDNTPGQNWMGITDGVAGGKDPGLFRSWQLSIPGEGIVVSEQDRIPKLFFPSEIVVTSQQLEFTASVIASRDMLPGQLKIHFPNGIHFTEKLQEGFNTFSHTIPANTLPAGELFPSVELVQDGRKISSSKVPLTAIDRNYIDSLANRAEKKTILLEQKIEKIQGSVGVPSYLQATASIARFLIKLARQDVCTDTILRARTITPKKEWVKSDFAYLQYTFSRALKNITYLDKWLARALRDAEEMLAGQRPVLTVPRPAVGVRPTIVDGGFHIEGRECFFVGPNTWYLKPEQLPLIAATGMNLVNLFSYKGKILEEMIEICEKSGLYFTIRNTGGGPSQLNSGWLEKRFSELEQSISEIRRINHSPAALYLITQEEGYHLDPNRDRITTAFRIHLKKKFGTIQHLNKAMGTHLTNYDQIKDALSLKDPGLKYEFFCFEAARQRAALRRIHAQKREFFTLPFSSHFSSLLLLPYDTLQLAADWEGNFAEFEVPGFDAGIFPDSGGEWAMNWSLGETLLCDLLRSFYPDRPIGNNEGHVIPNGYRNDISYELSYAQNMLPFLHGRNAVSVWLWADDYHSAWGNFTFTRANAFHGLMDVALDLNRLAPEIAAFRRAETPVAILYSIPSFARPGYIRDLLEGYEGCSFSGFPVRFISERQIKEGKLKDFRALIVANAQCVSEEIFRKIHAFAQHGGTVCLFGSEALSLNEYSQKQSGRTEILKTFISIPCGNVKSYSIAYRKLLKSLNVKPPVPISGGDSDEHPYGIESRSVVLPDGKKLIYAINLNKYPVTIKLPMGKWENLRTGLQGDTNLKLKPLELVLMKTK